MEGRDVVVEDFEEELGVNDVNLHLDGLVGGECISICVGLGSWVVIYMVWIL